VTDVEKVLYQNISGFSGVNAALAVALKQRMPDRVVFPGINAVKFRVGFLSVLLSSVHVVRLICSTFRPSSAPLRPFCG
jgi:hypothetical protein